MRSPVTFLRVSIVASIAAALVLVSFAGTRIQPSRAAASTIDVSTMVMGGDDGAYPPCPPIATPEATSVSTMGSTAASTMMATAGTMSPTLDVATMAPTMFVDEGAAMAGCNLTAVLMGKNEAPASGDPEGRGSATLMISRPASGPGEVCFNIHGSAIKLPGTASYLGKGAAGTAGQKVIPFSAINGGGDAVGCTENVDRDLIKAILTRPDQYFVNVETGSFPNGALRGQLSAASK